MENRYERLVLWKIERLNNSKNGNPRFLFTFTDHRTALLSTDAGVGYEIGNPGLRAGDTVDVLFTEAGRVSDMRAVSDEEQREDSIDEARRGEVDPDDPALVYHGNGEWRREPLPDGDPVVFIATRFSFDEEEAWGDEPHQTMLGVFSSEESAWQAVAEDGADIHAEFEEEEDWDTFIAQEYDWAVESHKLLS